MKQILLILFVSSSCSGCAGGASAFHTWVVAHQATIAEVALVAGAVSQVEGALINTKNLVEEVTE